MAKKTTTTNPILSASAALSQAKLGSTIDYSAALDPTIDILRKRVDKANKTTETFLNNMPEDFSAEIVPVEARAELEAFLKENKERYVELSKELGKLSNRPTSQAYIDAKSELDSIKNAFTNTKDTLTNFAKIRQFATDNISNWSPNILDKDFLMYEEIIGKEAYNNLDYTLDGVFYTDVAGNRINLNDIKNPDLRNQTAINGLFQGITSSFELGGRGVKLNISEDGSPIDTNSRIIFKNISSITNNPKAAADLFIGGVPGYENDVDSNPAYQYISQQAATNPEYKNLPKLENGSIDAQSDEYKLALDKLKTNVPTQWLNSFLMDIVKDSNADGFKLYKPKKTSGGEGINMQPTINAIKAGAKIIPLPSTFGAGIVASLKPNGKYYISSGARASQMFDPQADEIGYTLEELGKVLGLKISGAKSDPMDTNNDGVISDEEFNRAMGRNTSSGIFPTLQLPRNNN